MPEYIDYDDDPADTAAFQWMRTPLGRKMVERAGKMPSVTVRRAFRAGFLRGVKTERDKAAEAE